MKGVPALLSPQVPLNQRMKLASKSSHAGSKPHPDRFDGPLKSGRNLIKSQPGLTGQLDDLPFFRRQRQESRLNHRLERLGDA